MARCVAFTGSTTGGALSSVSSNVPASATPQPAHTLRPGLSPATVASAGVSRAVTCPTAGCRSCVMERDFSCHVINLL